MDRENPYRIPTPSLVSLSGGRTSAYMLWHILQAFGGKLPDGVRVAFFNTGKERQETFDFLRNIDRHWGTETTWLEYDRVQDDLREWHNTYRVVTYETASRGGEPFWKLIQAKRYLPNAVMRFCTSELKVKIGDKWMRDQGFTPFTTAIGFRADEDRPTRPDAVYPMADAGVTLDDVMEFWSRQPFDLGLKRGEGNCDLCFLKGKRNLVQLIAKRPQAARWWSKQEEEVGKLHGKSLARFSSRYTYEDLRVQALGGAMFAPAAEDEQEQSISCFCTD